MINIALVEDNQSEKDILLSYLCQYEVEENISFKIHCYSDPVRFLDQIQIKFDIVFMDIEMPLMNGMDGAKEFRQRDQSAVIIFVTNLAQFAVEGYEVNALYYLLKPVEYQSFCTKMRRAIEICTKKEEEELVLTKASGVVRIKVSELLYLNISGHLIYFHTKQGIYDAWGSLGEYEEKLAEYGFLRCHNTYLVNPKHIQTVDRQDILMSNGEHVSISFKKRREFMEKLTLWLGEHTNV